MNSFPILESLQDCFEPELTLEAIEKIERELGLQFPADYSEFLLLFNGGRFHHRVMFYLPHPVPFLSASEITAVFGKPHDQNEFGDLLGIMDLYDDRIPSGFVPIAACHRDLVLLKFSDTKSQFSGVWYWDADGYCTPELGDYIHWLADSFSDFLSMLVYDFEDYEDEDEFNEAETMPLFHAIQRGNAHLIAQYLAEGGDANCRDDLGCTLLMAAAKYSWPKIVEMLLQRGANPNGRDPHGRTPLHYAAQASRDSCIMLLKAGADVKARDYAGKSVLGEWWYELDQLLRAQGAED